ncbi:S-layer homology domain-containing protein [Paenibacillus oryzisoli]|uniref:S-layer homology domain-containing protein n=1 Tax=Paenibacillus oryzisoli TaxID=1850517 RepID=UPI003D2DAC53
MSMKHLVRNKIGAIAMSTLLVLELIPAFSLPTVSAATVTPVYAAAYMGSSSTTGTTLPSTVQIDGQSTPVTWSISDDAFAVPYDTVTVTGTAGGQSVSASVEVIPPASNPLVYFVDSGRGGDSYSMPATSSPVYEAVKQLSGIGLLNQVPDQKYVGGTTNWGFDDTTQKVKNSQNGNLTNPATDPSIWVVGLRSANNDIVYKLQAPEAGTYTITSGFYDWYGSRSRGIGPKIEYKDTAGTTKTITLDKLNTNATKSMSSEFTLPADMDGTAPVTLTYAYVDNEKPILSWFAIAKGAIKQSIVDAQLAASSTVRVTLDGNDVKADNLNGLTFKGFGVLSGNSSSALLMDYKSENPEAYVEMIRTLFGGDHPLIDHVKIEMGNDRNNSTGPDPATMRTADEAANVARHPGFQLAADAKKVNPNLKVSILRWNAPGWANSNDKIYTWYKNTILTAYRQYGYMVDYVNPGVNESAPDLTWTKQYASQVKSDSTGFDNDTEKSLYNSIKVVISDEVGIGSFGGTMVSDVTLRDAVAVAGYHYNTDDDSAGNFKKLADQLDKEVWNSEAQATFSNSAFRPNNNMKDPSVAGTGIGGTGGPLEMGNTIIKGFVNSRRTHFIYQPAIGSFYEGGQYSFKELLSARDPWSGWMHYDAGLVILRHFSDFANTGWENANNTAGIWRAVPQASYTGASGTNPVSGRNGTPSYMTLAAPDKSNFSTVIVNDSEYEKTYKLQALNMSYTGNPAMEVWETRAADQGAAFNSNYLKYLGNANADSGGVYTVHVKPYSIVTVTTLPKHGDAEFAKPLPVEGERTVLDTDATGAVQNTTDKILYADSFDYTGQTVPVLGADGQIAGSESYIDSRGGSKSVIPRYTSDRNGAFEAYLPDGSTNYVLRQQVDKVSMGLGGSWNSGDPVTGIGDNRWMNYKASIDVSFENNSTQSGANYAAIGARSQGGGSSHSITGTPYVLKFWFDGGWQLLVNNSAVASGNAATGTGGVKIDGFNTAYDAVHNIAVQVAGATISAYVDNVKLADYTDSAPKLSGRVDLASGYYNVRFDNLRVETVDGYAPYYSELLDGLEMNDLASPPATKLVYSGSWSHQNGQGMYVYQRSISTSQAANAALSYTFTGTGLDILGLNDGSAKLDVTVDGQTVAVSAATVASKELYQTYALRGLSNGQHTVQVKVVSGTLAVDAVAVVSGGVQAAPDVTTLQNAVTTAQTVSRQDEFTDNNWTLFETARSAAQAALANPVSFRLDQEGASQLAARLTAAQNQLFTGNMQSLATPLYAATYVGQLPTLPQKVEATLQDGSKQLVTVNWNLTGLSFDTAYATVAVTGTYGNLTTVCYVEVVPEHLLYFADLNATAASALGYNSPAYTAVAALATASGKALLNNTPDQAYNASTGWGYAGFNASGAASVSFKGIVTGPYSKQTTTGIYTANANGAYLTYSFDNLPAGKYALTFGTHDWWSVTRTADVYLEYDSKSVLMDTFTLTSPTIDAVKSYTVTKEQAGTLKLKLVAKTNNQSPLLSFVGLSEVIQAQPADKSALQALYDSNKNKVNDNYTQQSWSSFQDALAGALSVLGNADATQQQVDTALQALTNAVGGLVQNSATVRTTELYATYVNAVPQLPTRIRLVDGGPEYDITAWTTDGNNGMTAADFATPYATVTVYGKYMDGVEKQFTAYVEVVPSNVKYFIDAGAANSYVYDAVRKLTGSALLNGSTNQVYNSDSGWGYIALGSNGVTKPIINKSAQSDLDKNATGIMIDGGDPLSTLSYQLDGLEGGKSYRFTSYHRLWWSNEMPIKITITYTLNGETVTQIVNRLHLDHTGHSQQVTYTLNLPQGATDVKYVLTDAGSYTSGPGAGKTNKNPAISWLAVEELSAPAAPVTYTSLGGVAGENSDVWFDTNGAPIQAHGGQVTWVDNVAWNGNVPTYTASPANGDGAWVWVGEDKTYGGRPIGGIHTYASKDMYNWVDMGVALYPHRVFPVEKTADGQGVQVSETQLAALKERAMGTAGSGTNELGQPLTQSDIDYARDFLQAYVDRGVHPDYSRANDASFNYKTASYDNDSLKLAFDRTYAYYTIMERPKLLYNDQTKKYVLVYHVDGPADTRIVENFDTLKNTPAADTGVSRYSRAQMGFAVADSPFGPFKLVNAQRMNDVDGYYDTSKGMARDMTVFKDDDGKAYAIYSSEENKYMYISLLNDSYTAPATNGTEGRGETFTARVLPDTSREAPAIFKYNGYYYLITSGTTGWDPNPSIVYRANNIFGNTTDGGQTFTPYTKLGNPFPNDTTNTSYRTQSTAVIPYDPENGLFIYMGDRWIQKALDTSGYVWIPVQISANGTHIEGQTLSDWTLDVLDNLAPLQVLTTSDHTFKLGETLQLPDTLDVKKGSITYSNVPVSWDSASLEAARLSLGIATVKGTLGGSSAVAGSTVDYQVTVTLPDNVLYFMNPETSAVAQYTELVNAYTAATGKSLQHDVTDQVYNPEIGNTWGYVGSNSAVRASTTDIFQSLRYVTGTTDRNLTYKFDVAKGDYDVYIGFYDPWFQYSQSNRVVNTSINGTTVESGRIITDAYKVAEHKDIVMDNAGTMDITVSPAKSGSNTDAQLSWILISKKDAESEGPDTEKPVITLLGSPIVNLHPGDSYTDAGVTAADDRDGDITANTVTTITYNGNLVPAISTVTSATYVVHYNVSDLAGNAALEVTRLVNIVEDLDTVVPVITLTGQSVVNLTAGDSYTDAGATAVDDRDGGITSRIVTTVTKDGNPVAGVNTAVAGTYVYHYNVSDLAGNAALEITRTVIVTPNDGEDTTPSDPTPDTTPTAPALPETPANTLVLGNNDVSNATNGTVAVKVSEGIETVVLPADAAEKMDDNGLRLDLPKLSIEFSKAALNSIQGAAGGSSEGTQIQISAVAVSKDTVGKLSSPTGVQLGAASEVYNFSLSVVSADGTKIPVTTFKEPLVLTLKVDPNANPDLLGIYYIADDGKLEFIGGKLVDGMMVAKVSHFSKYAVLEYNKTFADVSASFWANGIIKKMAAKHIIDGVDDTHFNPQGNVTRAQFAAMLVRALGLTDGHVASFKDVTADAWYADAVAKASAAGLVTGRTSDTFAPDADVTREEMAVMIVRAYEYLHGKTTAPTSPSAFGDQGEIGDWAQSAVGAAQAWGLISGRSGNLFAPQAKMNRAESAQVIANLLP